MRCKKTKIVLDADVIIHFIEADCFSLLPEIFPEYDYVILDVVYNEVSKNNKTKNFIDNYLHHIPKLKYEVFMPKGESMKEYFCSKNNIVYLTTLDFLYYAYCRKKMTEQECKDFIQSVNDSGSRLPKIDITQYICSVQI